MTDGNNSAREAIKILNKEVQRSINGQEYVVERLIIALLANGNVLVEGLPGLAIVHDGLCHHLMLSYEANAEGISSDQ